MGRIASITYKPADDEAGVGDYVRVPVGDAVLIAGHGIEGDMKGGVAGRHLSVLSLESVRSLEADGFNGAPGALGEQIVIEGIDVDGLGAGDRLKLGESALIEVVQSRNGCAKLESNQGKSKEETVGRLGKMVNVVEGGPIRVGDEVTRVP